MEHTKSSSGQEMLAHAIPRYRRQGICIKQEHSFFLFPTGKIGFDISCFSVFLLTLLWFLPVTLFVKKRVQKRQCPPH